MRAAPGQGSVLSGPSMVNRRTSTPATPTASSVASAAIQLLVVRASACSKHLSDCYTDLFLRCPALDATRTRHDATCRCALQLARLTAPRISNKSYLAKRCARPRDDGLQYNLKPCMAEWQSVAESADCSNCSNVTRGPGKPGGAAAASVGGYLVRSLTLSLSFTIHYCFAIEIDVVLDSSCSHCKMRASSGQDYTDICDSGIQCSYRIKASPS